MDEILLTRAEATALLGRFSHEHDRFAMPDDIVDIVSRAQLLKVARWLEKHNHADVFPALSGDTLIRGSDMQALRAAAEEVRK